MTAARKKGLPAQWLLDMGALPNGDPKNREYGFEIRPVNYEKRVNGIQVVVESDTGLACIEEYTETGRTVAVVPLSDRPVTGTELVRLVDGLRAANNRNEKSLRPRENK